jgi:putative pyruvate formate lyase activating enzyme
MPDFDRLWVWQEPALAGSLGWYRQVAANRMPAKFVIAATIPVAVPMSAAEEDLWVELDRLAPIFLRRRQSIREHESSLDMRGGGPSLLDLCNELAQRMLTHCNFCRWNCRVDRSQGAKLGGCKLGAETRVSSYFHHPGEELVYRGTDGSGTIFFTSCNMRCAFCQNGDISTDKDNGEAVAARTLATMAWLLRLEGCHNINWVGGDPTIHLHTIIAAIALLGDPDFAPTRTDLMRAAPTKSDYFGRAPIDAAGATHDGRFNAPMLWNSNFFMTPEAMKLLRLLMDVWLPDFKFGPGRCAVNLARTSWYWETVTENLLFLRDWGEDFTIRHLVMPNHVECCTYPVLDWIAEQIPDAPVNIMDQYHPDNFCDPANAKYDPRHADLARRPTHDEVRAAYRYAGCRGLKFEAITYERQKLGVAL